MNKRTYVAMPLTPMVKKLLIIMAGIWVVQLVEMRTTGGFVNEILALTPLRVTEQFAVWQVATYMWLHSTGDFSHILFNGLFLWMFGSTLEQAWGAKAFLKFYLICGIGAGIVILISGILFAPTIAVLGASGAIYGLVVAWAIAFPNRVIYFFGIFPMKGKHFVLIPIGFAFVDFLMNAQGVSHAAHLGGMAIGALLVTGFWKPDKAYKRLRYWWLRRKLKVLEGERNKNQPPPASGSADRRPPDGGYWH